MCVCERERGHLRKDETDGLLIGAKSQARGP